jgi:hypothetical protein
MLFHLALHNVTSMKQKEAVQKAEFLDNPLHGRVI